MQYKLMKHDVKVSLYGLGCMRLPQVEQDGQSVIDRPQAIEMIRWAIDNGCNYIDTAWGYHDGNSERVVGEALKDGYRERTLLASKLPVWTLEKYEDCEDRLQTQLEKLQTSYLDFYLLHGLNKKSWEDCKRLGVLDFMKDARERGLIRYIAFSFHDDMDTFKEIIDSFDWDMCQIQMNILDADRQATTEGMNYAGEKGIPVVIMEPLKGGKLTMGVPEEVQAIWDGADVKRSPLEWAFRWLCSFPAVTVVLSGASSFEQLKGGMACFDNGRVTSEPLTENEQQTVEKVRAAYAARTKVGCTNCRYCMPCPNGVDIPGIFSAYNNAYMFGYAPGYQREYGRYLNEGSDASKCIECGACEAACPQHIEIIDMLKEAHEVFTK